MMRPVDEEVPAGKRQRVLKHSDLRLHWAGGGGESAFVQRTTIKVKQACFSNTLICALGIRLADSLHH
jgi:hypothetical protein